MKEKLEKTLMFDRGTTYQGIAMLTDYFKAEYGLDEAVKEVVLSHEAFAIFALDTLKLNGYIHSIRPIDFKYAKIMGVRISAR